MRHRRPARAATRLLSILLPLSLAVPLAAQRPQLAELRVLVRDAEGGAVADAQVSARPHATAVPDGALGSEERRGTTDAVGAVTLQLPVGLANITVRRLGFTPHDLTADVRAGQTTTVTVNLFSASQELNEVTVSDERTADVTFMEGFNERRRKGIGTFVTREQIARRRPVVMSDMLRTVPGLRMVFINGQQVPRFSRSMGRTNIDCPPQYWIDGMRVDNYNIDQMQPADIEGLEFYGLSSTPSQFLRGSSGTSNCGTIVIWTRRP